MLGGVNYDDVVEFYGNASRAASELGLTRQALSKWKTRGITFEQQYRIQMQTKGRLKANVNSIRCRPTEPAKKRAA